MASQHQRSSNRPPSDDQLNNSNNSRDTQTQPQDVDSNDSLSPTQQHSPSKAKSKDPYQHGKPQNDPGSSVVTPAARRESRPSTDVDMAGLEKCYLEFVFDIENVQFNHLGQYYIKLAVNSSYVRNTENYETYGKIRIRKGDNGYLESGNEAVTDMVAQEETKQFYVFEDHKVTFYLPKGFCKNDKNYDVYLSVEAYEVQPGGSKRVGEAKFAIYPRTNAPKVNLHAGNDEDLYKANNHMTLLRTLSTENLKMHCGRLQYTARFRRIKKPPDNDASPEPSMIEEPTPRDPSPKASEPDSPEPHTPTPVPKNPTPKPPVEEDTPRVKDQAGIKRALESPLEPDESGLARTLPGSAHVSRPGYEDILVIYHGANNLPSLSDGRTPLPFGSVSTSSREQLGRKAAACTGATYNPTYTPTWEEAMVVELEARKSQAESLILKVCDAVSKEVLVDYTLPVSYLKPFHHYHLELVQPNKEDTGRTHLYATIVRRTAGLSLDHSSPNYMALEVLLRGVKEPLNSPVGSLIVVGRMVTDYFTYKRNKLSTLGGARAAGITVTSVTFPSPHPSSLAVPDEKVEGHPQVTLPGKPVEHPQWNHPFLFSNNRDKATLFTPGAALVFEFYHATAALTDMSWSLHSPVGFSVVLLDQNVYKQLNSPTGQVGIRVEGLPIQGSQLRTVNNRTPTIGVVLKLILSEQPDSVSKVSDLELLPLMGSPNEGPPYIQTSDILKDNPTEDYLQRTNGSPDLHRYPMLYRKIKPDILPIKDDDMPPTDAMDSILPEYQYIFTDPDSKKPVPGQLIAPDRLTEDTGQQSVHLLDYQMRELEKYRTAVHKMGSDIFTLRQQVRDLEAQNSQLRRELSNYNDATRLLMDSQELDGLTKPELASRYVSLKQKLATQTSELKTYRDRVQQLQNDLIKKNDKEKQYSQINHAHKSQNELVQKLQRKADKAKLLEDQIRKQERIISKMEQLLAKNGGSRPDKGGLDLLDENKRLRDEIADMRDRQEPRKPTDDFEKLELYEKLDRAEGRVASLERQMTENARRWSKERSDLLVRLQEAEHGFRGSPIGSYSKLDSIKSQEDPRRFSKPSRKSNYTSSYY